MLRSLLNNQGGYGRLTAGTVTLAVTVLMVLIYQFFVFRVNDQPRLPGRPADAVAAVQLFPQTLPVLADMAYLIEVQTENGDTRRLPKFFHRAPGILTDERGQVIDEGIFDLPTDIDDVQFATLSLFNDRSLQQPVVIRFLEGEKQNDRIFLTFNTDLSQLKARYMLSTPTDNNSLVNERSGLWFGEVVQNRSQLTLPDLPQGWVYEGWAIINDQPITTGRFTSVNERDRFAGFSDTRAQGPNFPGEDFLLDPPVAVFPDLRFPVDLAGEEVMLTVEPDVNGVDPTGQSPFAGTFIRQPIPRLAQAGVLYDLEYKSDFLPKATLVLR